MAEHLKQRAGAPKGFFDAEAAGLRWLGEPEVVPVVPVLDVGPDVVLLEELQSTRPTASAARLFGARLAMLHNTGASAFGWTPSATAWFGPLEAPFEVSHTPRARFAQFWAEDRLRPVAAAAAPVLDPPVSPT